MWYYAENDKQRGPVTEADLAALHRAGTIHSDSLVWREGMANWRPFSEAVGTPPRAGDAPPPLIEMAAGAVICSECRKSFAPSEVIRYGTVNVCAACKLTFVQKLKEGAAIGYSMEYARILSRLAAKLLDMVIRAMLGGTLGLVVGLVSGPARRGVGVQLLLGVSGILINICYSCFFLGKYGATPGKMACRIKVVTPQGGPISYGCAAVRPLAEIVSSLIFAIGYLMAFWDPEKRTLHDRMCNTRVIKT